MGIGPRDAGDMTLWEYGGLLHHWNLSHGGEEADEAIEPPSVELFEAMMADAALHSGAVH